MLSVADKVLLHPTSKEIPEFKELSGLIAMYNDESDLDLLKRAYDYAKKHHEKQVRNNGDPFFVHPFRTAQILALLCMDDITLSAGLLHDTIEDTYADYIDLKNAFGEQIANLVDWVTKVGRFKYSDYQRYQVENFRKLVLAIARDVRVILIKLCDRLHNMQTLKYVKEHKQKRIAEETLRIYAPFANRLGIGWMKNTLEDLSFKFINPEEATRLKTRLKESEADRQKYIDKAVQILKEQLQEYGIEAKVTGRSKHLYSIYHKMIAQGIDFEQVHDILGLRAIVGSRQDCYHALAAVYDLWKPVPGRFKDYISLPKSNGYQSLHTTVIGYENFKLEIQIRTEEMHRIAEEGIAAHWLYKEGGKIANPAMFQWLRDMVSQFQQDKIQDAQDSSDPDDESTVFVKNVEHSLFVTKDVYVLTPKNDIKVLPKGSTVIDFAFTIHSDLGLHCKQAKVNGRLVPLSYELKDGDTVEIIVDRNQYPSRDWLRFVKTPKARSKIRRFLSEIEVKDNIKVGKELLNMELRKRRIGLQKLSRSGKLNQFVSENEFENTDDLYNRIGSKKINVNDVIRKMELMGIIPREPTRTRKSSQDDRKIPKPSENIKVAGYYNVMSHLAKCCNPIAGDPIIGFITQGHGISVHRRDCPNFTSRYHNPSRIIDVEWIDSDKTRFPVHLELDALDRRGLLKEISDIIHQMDINITDTVLRVVDTRTAKGHVTIQVTGVNQLQRVIDSLKQIKGIRKVRRK